MSVAIDDLMECVTVEIERKSNIIVSCMYRRPGTLIETFTDVVEDLLSKVKGNKTFCICGDRNIDFFFLKMSNHKASSDFFELFFGRGFYPLITKPSRVTEKSATLIDHIFINCLESNIISGLVINDISDHLPVFVTLDYKMTRKEEVCVDRYIRIRNDDAINKLKQDLMKDWNEVLVNNVNAAYEAFLNTYFGFV